MAAAIVNLRQARKRKRRAEDETHAAENRAAFGRTRQERTLTAALNTLQARTLDGQRLDRDDEADDSKTT